MEDYKNKYEEAMLRMNKWVEDSEIIDPKEVAEFVFPEFKESGDERIRKWLIKAMKHLSEESTFFLEVPKDKVISWLEKQGEQKSAEIPMTLDEAIAHCKEKSCGNSACASQHQQLAQWLAELKEYKEQKPAWSEEDEYNLNWIIRDYERASQTAISSVWNGRFKMIVDWLKSLKERVQPQNTWKPSDEQMKQLGWIAEQNKDNMIGKELMSLYQDLKKLKRE